jgi:hypothetical protein
MKTKEERMLSRPLTFGRITESRMLLVLCSSRLPFLLLVNIFHTATSWLYLSGLYYCKVLDTGPKAHYIATFPPEALLG